MLHFNFRLMYVPLISFDMLLGAICIQYLYTTGIFNHKKNYMLTYKIIIKICKHLPDKELPS